MRITPQKRTKILELKGFFASADRKALIEACAASDDERLRFWAKIRADEKKFHHMTDIYLAQKATVTFKAISECYLDYRRSQGYVELAERLPQAMADIAEDALSRRMTCPKCAGNGTMQIEDEEISCEACWGTGVLVKTGDPDARKAMLEAAKITGQKGPLLAQQFNFDGGFSVESMITSGEKLMGDK